MSSREAGFGPLLRAHRTRANLTQEMLAEQAGVSTRTISDLERGIFHRPHPGTVRRLSDALPLSTEERWALEEAARPPAEERSSVQRSGPSRRPFSSLPFESTPFIGREREIEAVADMLREDDVRLLTLLGPGGVGKTRLALQVASTVEKNFADGVLFASLASVRDPDLVGAAVANALGVSPDPGEHIDKRVIRHIQEREVLLILDNFEHLRDGPSLVLDIFTDCPGVTQLVTSRTPLRLSVEALYEVPPLQVPDVASLPPVTMLSENEAVALFRERARTVKGDFEVTDHNARDVVEICRHLDGLPLAIVLAATWVRLLPPAALRQQLSHRLRLLVAAASDAPVRHGSLRAAIDSSYELLSAVERAFFASLAVFEGGWTVDASQAISSPGEELTVHLLRALRDGSLIESVDGLGAARFRFLETIREYAGEKLRDSGEERKVCDAHAAFFLALAEAHGTVLGGVLPPDSTAVFDADLDNFRAALRHLLNVGRSEDGLRLATALSLYCFDRGYWSESEFWLDTALRQGESVDRVVRARGQLVLGTSLYNSGSYERAEKLLKSALNGFSEEDDPEWRAETLDSLGGLADAGGRHDEAVALYEESLRLATLAGNHRLRTQALNDLGVSAAMHGEYHVAQAHLTQVLNLARIMGDGVTVGYALCNSGWVEYRLGHYAEAEELYDECLAITEVQPLVAHALGDLGRVESARGQFERAKERMRESMLLAQRIGDSRQLVQMLSGMAEVRAALGDATGAARLKGAEDAARKRSGIVIWEAERKDHEAVLTILKATLGEERFAAAWSAGRELTLDEAVREAMHEPEDRGLRLVERRAK